MTLESHRHAMLTFLRLALISAEKKQSLGCDRFLTLGAIESAFGDYFEISQRCRQMILESAPKHIFSQYPDVENALMDEDFDPFLKQARKFCSLEKGELLLEGYPIPASEDEEESALSKANRILTAIQNTGR